MADCIRVMLVDDHTLFRQGIRSLLQGRESVEVVAEAGSAEDALTSLGSTPCDIILLDLCLPDYDGIWFIQSVRDRFPEVSVLVLTMYLENHLVVGSLKAGANGYLPKCATREELVQAIECVHRGGSYIHPEVAPLVLQQLRGQIREALPENEEFSAREKQILTMAGQGMKNNQIAERLCLSTSTVKSHFQTLYRKLAVADRTHAVLESLRRGIIHAPGLDASSPEG